VHKFEITSAEGGAAFPVLINLNASANRVTGKDRDTVYVDLTVGLEREMVDQELIALLSKQLRLEVEKLAIASGRSIDRKVVIVMGLTPDEIEKRLFAYS